MPGNACVAVEGKNLELLSNMSKFLINKIIVQCNLVLFDCGPL